MSESTRDRFARLAGQTGRSMTQLVDEAADALERRVFFEQLATRFDELHDRPSMWAEIEAERALEAGSLHDQSP